MALSFIQANFCLILEENKLKIIYFFRITKKSLNKNDDFGYFYLTSYYEKITQSSKNKSKLIPITI